MRPAMFDWTPIPAPGQREPFVPMFERLLRHMDELVDELRERDNLAYTFREGAATSDSLTASFYRETGRVVDWSG